MTTPHQTSHPKKSDNHEVHDQDHHESQAHIAAETKLAKEISQLALAIKQIEKLQPFAALRNRKQFFAYSFLHGLLVGFGSVLGASLLVGLFIFLLKQIEFAPWIGNFVQKILESMNMN